MKINQRVKNNKKNGRTRFKNNESFFFQMVESINNIKLYKLGNYLLGEVLGLYLHRLMWGKNTFLSPINYMCRCIFLATREILRCEIKGDGRSLFFVGREISSRRNDHTTNVMKVIGLLDDYVIAFGRRTGGITFRRISTLLLPLVWNIQLRSCIIGLRTRWALIYALYVGYIQFLDIKKIGKKTKQKDGIFKNIFFLTDVHPSGQLIGRYFKKRGASVIELMHGLNDGYGEELFCFMKFSQADYLLSYSEFATNIKSEIRKYNLYPKGVREVGNYSFIDCKEKNHMVGGEVKRIGVFLDGSDNKTIMDINLNMIMLVYKALKDNHVAIYVKCHPRATKEEIDYYLKRIDFEIEGIYSYEKLSLELEKDTDVVIVHKSTIIEETVHQNIPTFVFGENNTLRDVLPSEMLFYDECELSHMIEDIASGGKNEIMVGLKEYICGKGNVRDNYTEFLTEIGAC